MRWTARLAAALFGMAVLAVALSGAATATAAKHPATAQRAAHAVPGKHLAPTTVVPRALPPKYSVAISALFTVPANGQASGTVTCPGKTVPYGGGGVASSTSTLTNLNSSIPLSTGWRVDFNDASGAADTFRVYAVCAKKNAFWSIVSGTVVDNPAGSQASATVTCPAGTKVTGGGVFSSSGSTAVNINTSYPIKSGKGASASYIWRGDENNASTFDASVTAYAVCGHAPGYQIVTGTAVTANPSTQTSATATCPSPKVPLGGGGFSSSGSTVVDLNSTLPLSGAWEVYEDNNNTSANTLIPYAVCAGT